MIEALIVTFFPVLFLTILFGGGALFRRRSNIEQDGDPPMDKRIFYISKYSILILWAAMVVQSWGVKLSFIRGPRWLEWAALCLWVLGFLLLLAGRFGLGSSFRIGSPQEGTSLRVGGLFLLSRNPMYLGVFATLLASILRTLNPILLAIGIFVAAVHHRIVLAEEDYLAGVFGQEYAEYRKRVRRYV